MVTQGDALIKWKKMQDCYGNGNEVWVLKLGLFHLQIDEEKNGDFAGFSWDITYGTGKWPHEIFRIYEVRCGCFKTLEAAQNSAIRELKRMIKPIVNVVF